MHLLPFVLLVAATGALAERSLSLRLSGPSSFVAPESAIVTATLTNTGDDELILLNDPNTILSDLPTRKFAIAHADGSSPRFIGALAKYVPERATSLTTLAAGASISTIHSLSHAYDIACSGAGNYTIEPTSSSFHILTENGIEEVVAEATAYKARLPEDVLVAAQQISLVGGRRNRCDNNGDDNDQGVRDADDIAAALRHPKFIGCSAPRQMQILAAAKAAQTYSRTAYFYLHSLNFTTPVRYTMWFGTFTSARHEHIVSNFQRICDHSFVTSTYNCQCEEDVFAYVYKGRTGHTWLCNGFWTAATTGTDSKAGTLIRVAFHSAAMAGTKDVVHGQSGAKDLARRDASEAVANADNYEYFAEDMPGLS